VIDGALPYPLPIVLGHEGAGVVEAVGSAVTQVAPAIMWWRRGIRIAGIVSIANATCRSCASRSPGTSPRDTCWTGRPGSRGTTASCIIFLSFRRTRQKGEVMPVVTANRHAIRFEIEGPAGAPVVAFSNSLGTTLEMWDAQIAACQTRYRCLRFDTRGHGESEVVTGPATVDDLANDFARLLDALAIENAHLVGLSLGGMMGQAFAVRHPHRLRSLILVSTTAHTPPPEAWTARAETVRREGMGAIADAVMQRWFTPAFRETASPAVRDNERRFRESSPEGYAHCCEIIGRLDLREANRKIRTPTLIVVGALDPATPPSMAEEMHSRIVNSDMLVISRAAHLLAAERPRLLNAAIQSFVALNS